MTEQATPRASKRKPSPSTVALSAIAAFLAVLAFLTFQLRAGHDPALSAPAKVAQVSQQPRRVIVRKVEDDYVITRVVPAQPLVGSSSQPALTTGSSGGSASAAPAPVVSVAPVPAPAAAPAPAPVTRTS